MNFTINDQSNAMPISLSTKEALGELEFLLILEADPKLKSRSFIFETEFIDFFIYIIERVPKRNNIVPFMNNLIDEALEKSIAQISAILLHNNADGTEIFNLVSGKKLILNGDRKAYNEQIQGTATTAKGLETRPWQTYNNWLLAEIFWRAFIASQDPGFTVTPIKDEDAENAKEIFDDPNFRPLMAMKAAYAAAGKPNHGFAYADIIIRPIPEWHLLTQKPKQMSRLRKVVL